MRQQGFFILVLMFMLMGCSGSPLKTSYQAERNLMSMVDLKKDMKRYDVRRIMGRPYKVEKRTCENTNYEIWYYLTQGVNIDQNRLVDRNFTPFVFQNQILIGWGWKFYNYIFDLKQAREKKEAEIRQRYTDDKEEWPSNEHKIIESPKKDQEGNDAIEETLRQFITPEEQNNNSNPQKKLEQEKTEQPNNNLPLSEKEPFPEKNSQTKDKCQKNSEE